MKRKLLLLITILAFPAFLWSQETVECYPASGVYNTGSTNGTEFTQTSLIKTAAGLVEVGWARFDLSSVPANAPIQSVELHIYVVGDNTAYWRVMSMEEDPLLGTAESVFADCTSGNIYGGWEEGNFPEPDWFIADLGEDAASVLQDQLADGWFAISMWEFESSGTYAIECEGWNETNPPYLVVTHLAVGTPFPAYDPDPANGTFEVGLESDLNWTFGANTESYDLYFGTDNPPTTKVIDNEASGATGTYDPGTLEYSTTYYWQVVSRNSTSEDVLGPIWSFASECGPSTLPITENFEGVLPPELPYCWNAIVNSTSPDPFVQTAIFFGIDNSNCVQFDNSGDLSASLLFISPQIDGGVAGKYVNFFAWGFFPTLSVGTITNPSDESTYTEMATFTLSDVYLDYQEFEVFFTNYTGTDNYIAFKAIPTSTTAGAWIDNILIDFAPTCPNPTDLYTSETTTNSATLGWTENGEATQWNIEYGLFGFTPTGVGNATATTNPFELTGLEPGTFYEFYVQADCGGGAVSYWIGPSWFQADCEASSVPYFEGFETTTIPEIPLCMAVENTNGDGNLWFTDNTEPYAGENTIRINYNEILAMNDWFYSAPLDLLGGVEYMVEFFYTSNSATYIERLEVKWGTEAASTAMTNGPIFADLSINYAYDYHEGVGFFTPDTDGVYYVGWHGFSIANQFNIFVDNITIDVSPTCLKPNEVYVSPPTNNSTIVHWTENGSATQWNIEYVYAGVTPTGVPTVVANSNPFEITGLESATEYDCYVQADCGEGNVSLWSEAVTFTTQCDALDVPLFEDFTNVTPPDLPDCWMKYVNSTSTNAYVITHPLASLSPPYGLAMENDTDIEADVILISPPISETDGAAGKYINFFAWGYASEISIGTMSDPYDVSTYTEYSTISLTEDWQEYDVFFANYTGTDSFIALKGVYSNIYQSIYIDDITIDHSPTCPNPTNLFVSSSTANEAILNWTENGSATQWNIEYVYAGVTPTGVPTVVANSNPFEITGLESGTKYDCYVQADCGGGEISLWSQPTTFTTLCDVLALPIFEDFTNVTPPDLPDCWKKYVGSSSTTATVETTQSSYLSPPYSLEIENTNYLEADVILISPLITDDDGAAGKYLSFFARSLAPELSVGTLSNPLDGSTYTELTTVTLTPGWQEFEVFFNNYTGTDSFIALKGVYDDNFQPIYIDDITIDYPSTCPTPNNLFISSSTANEAILNWTENGSATQWNIEYVYAGVTPTGVPTVVANSNPFEITGLESATEYDCYVQADCGEGIVSLWSEAVTFTTLCDALDVPFFEDFTNLTPPDLPDCWMKYVNSTSTNANVFTHPWASLSPPYGLVMENFTDIEADILLISPPISETDGVAGKYINFFAYGGAPQLLSIGTMSDPYDVSTYTEFTTISFTGDWQEYDVFFANYTGTDSFIALKGVYTNSYQTIYIDDITIDHSPICSEPNNLFVSSSTANEAILNWTENGDATQWNIEYVYAGENPTGVPTISVDTNPYELTGLEGGTEYEFYVQADCGGGDLSYWNGPAYFKTQCYPATLPYFEDFESIPIPPALPVCVGVENSNGDLNYWQTSMTLPNNGNYHMSVGWNGVLAMDDWFFSAPMDLLGGQTYNLVFYYTSSSNGTYVENLEVKFGTEPTGEGMTSEPIFVDEMFAYNNEYQEASVQFSPDESGSYYLGWHGYSLSSQDFIYVDDIYVEGENSLIVTATATPEEICEGEESELNGSGVGGTGNYTYSWTSDPAGFTSNIADPTVMPDVTTDYILELNDGMISAYDTVTVVVHDYPDAPGVPVGNAYLCADITNSTYSTSGASGADSYQWVLDPSEAGTVSGTGTSISVTWVENYVGSISLTVAGVNNGCIGEYSNPLTIIRYLPDVSLTPFDLVELDWPAFELTGGTPEGGIYSGTGVEDGMFDPGVAGLGDHIITYTYSDVSLCENSDEQVLTVVLDIGINELNNLKVNISPNPNDGLFTLNVNSSSSKAVNIMVVNNYGKEVFEITNAKLNENYSTEIDLSNYAKGLYYINIYSDDIYYVEKVIIK